MPWFKVDDSYWSHPKVLLSGLEARGVWVTAASWCAQHMTDGRIPQDVLLTLIPAAKRKVLAACDELERLGMWTRDGADWLFHDWTAYNPTRQQIEADRAQHRQRQQRYLSSKRANGPVTNGVSDGVSDKRPSHPIPSPKDGMGKGTHPIPADAVRWDALCRHGAPYAGRGCIECRTGKDLAR